MDVVSRRMSLVASWMQQKGIRSKDLFHQSKTKCASESAGACRQKMKLILIDYLSQLVTLSFVGHQGMDDAYSVQRGFVPPHLSPEDALSLGGAVAEYFGTYTSWSPPIRLCSPEPQRTQLRTMCYHGVSASLFTFDLQENEGEVDSPQLTPYYLHGCSCTAVQSLSAGEMRVAGDNEGTLQLCQSWRCSWEGREIIDSGRAREAMTRQPRQGTISQQCQVVKRGQICTPKARGPLGSRKRRSRGRIRHSHRQLQVGPRPPEKGLSGND